MHVRADAVAAWGTSIQAALLTVAAVYARRQLREAKTLREEQARPYVIVNFETDPTVPWMSRIVISNLGSTVAKDVRFRFDPPLESTMDTPRKLKVSDWKALADGLPTLTPNQSLSTSFDSLLARYADHNMSSLPRSSKVVVTYKGADGKRTYSDEYILDFHIYYNSFWSGRKGTDDLVKAIEDISSTLKSWTDSYGNRGVRVYPKNLDEHIAEYKARLEEFVAQRRPLGQEESGPEATPEPGKTSDPAEQIPTCEAEEVRENNESERQQSTTGASSQSAEAVIVESCLDPDVPS